MKRLILLTALAAAGCGDKDGGGDPAADDTGSVNGGDGGGDDGAGDDGAGDDTDCEPSVWYTDGDDDGYGSPGGAVEACEQPEGTAANSRDCDDSDGATWPGADEACDGEDNDCDDAVDEDTEALTWWPDDDRDGLGDPGRETVAACMAPTGYVDNSDDCDDADALAPAWVDAAAAADGDGSEGAPFQQISDALSAGRACAWVQPGTYGALYIERATFSATSLGSARDTVIDAGGEGSAAAVVNGNLTLEGFTLTGGYGTEVAYPSGCSYDGCYYHLGGGIYVSGGDATLRDVEIRDMALPYGVYSTGGGSVYRYGEGGGAYVEDGGLTLEGAAFSDLFAVYGGAIYIGAGAEVSLEDADVRDTDAYIGTLYMEGDTLEVRRAAFAVNSLGYGVIYARAVATEVDQATFAGNYSISSTASADIYGPGELRVRNSILAYNYEYGLYATGDVTLDSVAFYRAGLADNYRGTDGESLIYDVDPLFSRFTNNNNGADDDLTLSEESPFQDAGADGTYDADGSPAQLGAYGGDGG